MTALTLFQNELIKQLLCGADYCVAGTEQKYIHVFFLTLGGTAVLTCPRDWHPYWDKCLFISQTSGSWAEGQADCSVREATLLLLENKEELVN